MWIKIENTKIGVPIIVDILETTVAVMVAYPEQTVVTFDRVCESVDEAEKEFKKQVEWARAVMEVKA